MAASARRGIGTQPERPLLARASLPPDRSAAGVVRGGIAYTLQDLGTVPAGNGSLALGLNDRGDVVGTSMIERGPRAFLYSNAVLAPAGRYDAVLPAPTSLPLPAAGWMAAATIAGGAGCLWIRMAWRGA